MPEEMFVKTIYRGTLVFLWCHLFPLLTFTWEMFLVKYLKPFKQSLKNSLHCRVFTLHKEPIDGVQGSSESR